MSQESEPSQRPPQPSEEPGPKLSPALRIPFYLLIVLIVLDVGTILLATLLGIDLGLPTGGSTETSPEVVASQLDLGSLLFLQVLLVPVLAAVTHRFLTKIDTRPWSFFGAVWPGRQAAIHQAVATLAGAGLVLGLWAGFAHFFAGLTLAGLSQDFLAGSAWWPSPAGGLVVLVLFFGGFVLSSSIEEWIFRGYFFTSLREGMSWVNAAGLSSAFSVLLLAAQPDLGPAALINAFLIALVLAALRELTGGLWVPIVFRGGWNFLLANILSLPVSGFTGFRLLETTVEGEARWTGGDYGPEASWAMTGLLIAAVLGLAAAIEARRAPESEEGEG